MPRATGTFTVDLKPLGPDEHFDDPALGRMSIDKVFTGDLEATSRGQMLSARSGVEGSAGYVAIELVSGRLNGRAGTFVLQHSGAMARGRGETVVTVVPDSATDALSGLQGRMAIIISEGEHAYEFEYTFTD